MACFFTCLLIPAAVVGQSIPSGSGGDSVEMLYLFEVQPGPRWVAGRRPGAQEGFDQHMAWLSKLNSEGLLFMAGPFKDTAGGGLTVLRARDLDHARELVADEPWVRSGHLVARPIRPLYVGLSNFPRASVARDPVARDPVAGERVTAGTTRSLSKEVVVTGSLADIWSRWTTSAGIASFFSPDSTIELAVGGRYELYMSAAPDARGKRGSEGCRVLSFIPFEMLSFEWSFPPSIETLREADAKTHVVLRFESFAGGRILVRLDQLGWRSGDDWDAGYAYFDSAWDHVLRHFKQAVEGGDG